MNQRIVAALACALLLTTTLPAQVPQIVNYQGRVAVGTPAVNFNGTGQFKFALINTNGTTTYWSNDGTSTAGSAPTAAVSLSVANGLYSVLLGDTTLTNMTAVPTTVFTNSDVRLRVWFNDGTNGFQLLTPDQRIASVGYAYTANAAQTANTATTATTASTANTVADGAITSAKLASGAVTSSAIASGAVGSTQLAAGAVQSSKIVAGAITANELAASAVTSGKLADGAVTNAKIGTGAVGVDQIAAGAVTGAAWTTLPTTGAPSARGYQCSVWTGTEMILWGGTGASGDLADGVRYNPSTKTWTAMGSVNAPTARNRPRAVWTGTEMIVWGGSTGGTAVNTGARYNPTTNTWTAISTTGAPAGRIDPAAVWSGTEMLIWGGGVGFFGGASFNDGARYNPTTNTWTAMSNTGAPSARSEFCSVWTGTELLVWGGIDYLPGGQIFNDGARYNPTNNSWTPMTSTGAPSARWNGGAVWTGTEMLISTGAFNAKGAARYNPATNVWVTGSDAPFVCQQGPVVWTGTKMFVSGGGSLSYDVAKDAWLDLGSSAPAARFDSSAVWTGSEWLVWGGQYQGGSPYYGDGASFKYGNIAPGTIGYGGELGTGVVQAAQIAANAVGPTQLAFGAVGANQLAAGAVAAGKIANGAVGSSEIQDSAVSTVDIIDGAITTAKLATGAVTNAKLATPSITINTGTGLSGGGTVSLGGTLTLQATGGGSGVTSLTGGGGITVSGATGAVTLGSNATSANTAGTIVQRDGNGGFSAGSVTANTFNLPVTTSSSIGVVAQNGTALVHSYGDQNFFAGSGAGNFTMTGAVNTAIGSGALPVNTTGFSNSAFGWQTLNRNTTGTGNTAVGSQTLFSNTGGDYNTAVGIGAIGVGATGSNNTALGANALRSSIGSDNTATGLQALYSNTTGRNNTATGENALGRNTTGILNTALGYQAGFNLTTGDNNIDIGNVGVAAEAATIRIGTSGTQTRSFIAGIRGITTGSANVIAVLIDSNGQLGTVSSSRRYKEDIVDMSDASARLLALRPVTFRYKKAYDDGSKPIQFGLIAEEVAETFPELAVFNEDGQPETVKYQDLPPLLLNEFLKDHRRVDELAAKQETEVKQLREENAALKKRLGSLESAVMTLVATKAKPERAKSKVAIQRIGSNR